MGNVFHILPIPLNHPPTLHCSLLSSFPHLPQSQTNEELCEPAVEIRTMSLQMHLTEKLRQEDEEAE